MRNEEIVTDLARVGPLIEEGPDGWTTSYCILVELVDRELGSKRMRVVSKRFPKRFPRSPRDFYRTPLVSVKPLIPHLRAAGVRKFIEPCCGENDLTRLLESFGLRCVLASDIEGGHDALHIECFDAPIITNPPFFLLLPLLDHFIKRAPFTWLLLYADFAHKIYARPYIPHCSDIVAAGRTAWFGGGGTEEVAWFRFEAGHRAGPVFHNGELCGGRAVVCAGCGKPFRPLRSDARTCSDACRQRARRARVAVTEV